MTNNLHPFFRTIAYIAVVSMMSLISCVQLQSNDQGLSISHELRLRVLSFRQIYLQIQEEYVSNGVLQLPADRSVMAANLYTHPSIDWAALYHNSQPIPLDDPVKTMHTIILYDLADVGEGGVRVILFADGHLEISSWTTAK